MSRQPVSPRSSASRARRMNRQPDVDWWVDERLRAWSRYFKDRRTYSRCHSIEGRFDAFAKGCWDEGWGSQDEIPPASVPPILDLPSVLQTHAAVGLLVRPQKWSVTLNYCYPTLSRWQVLKIMKKYTGRRFSWRSYLNELDIARLRVAFYLTKPLGAAQSSCN